MGLICSKTANMLRGPFLFLLLIVLFPQFQRGHAEGDFFGIIRELGF